MPILILIFIYYANIDIGIVRFLLHHCLLWVLVHVQACALDVPPDVRAVKVTVDPSWRPQRAHGQYVKSAIASLIPGIPFQPWQISDVMGLKLILPGSK